MQFTVDGVDLTQGLNAGTVEPYQIHESYAWYGVHSRATNYCNGAKFSFTHEKSGTAYTLDVRIFNDTAAFRFIVPGANESRVPDEATTFTVPAGSTVWHHDLRGHYEGVHTNNAVADVSAGQWIAPPMTFKLPNGAGYGAITEADLKNYAGAADAFLRGSKVPNAHPFLKILAAQMAEHGGDAKTAQMMWSATYQTTHDKMIRANAAAHLRALQVEQDVTQIEELVERYRQAAGRAPSGFVDMTRAGHLRGVPVDPLGNPYLMSADGHVILSDPDAFPFTQKGLPAGYVAPVVPTILPSD
jgi:hypothetical protein